jgi:hypothetical protein
MGGDSTPDNLMRSDDLPARKPAATMAAMNTEEIAPNTPVTFTVPVLGVLRYIDSVNFEQGVVVHKGDTGTYYGHWPRPMREDGWHLVTAWIQGKRWFVPCHEEQFEIRS